MKIKELLSDESKWTQGAPAKDYDGRPVSVLSEDACCWCLIGAIWKCYGNQRDQYNEALCLILDQIPKLDSVTSWNDSPLRKFEDVKNLVEKLDI